MSNVTSLAGVREKRNAVAIATSVLQDLAHIQGRLIGYFHADGGNMATDTELCAAGLLCILAERLELAARTLKDGARTQQR